MAKKTKTTAKSKTSKKKGPETASSEDEGSGIIIETRAISGRARSRQALSTSQRKEN